MKRQRMFWRMLGEYVFDCMVFNAVFNSISVISRQPVHISMLSRSSFNQHSAQYCFQATGCFFQITIVETMDSGERGMNPVAMTIINPRKEYWPSRGSNQRPPILKFTTLPTEVWGSAWSILTKGECSLGRSSDLSNSGEYKRQTASETVI